jgi:glycerophosphoryl diester phosphodiesterase
VTSVDSSPQSDADDVAIDARGRRILLKWHMLRRAASEPPFSLRNLRAGLARNASMEVDIRLLGDGSWICLHDATLEAETDGSGPVANLDAQAISRLRISGSDYAPPLLADIVKAVKGAASSGACLQLDLKEPAAGLSAGAAASFAELIGPVAATCVLSGCDWVTVKRLAATVPKLRLGYDPYEAAEGRSFANPSELRAFVDDIGKSAPDAAIYYLHHRFVSLCLDNGLNPVAALKATGAMVDIWTLDPSLPGIEKILPRMVAAGADQITTNDPRRLAELWRRRDELKRNRHA